MATRILGPTDSRRRRRFLLGPILLASALLALFVAGAARAVHDLDFQLDGDVVTSPDGTVGGTTQEFDWADFFNAAGERIEPLPAGFDASTFIRDFALNTDGSFNSSDRTTWATGSKDTQNVGGGGQVNGSWECKRDNNLLDKNDIMNAYAVSYSPTGGDEVLYFGLERNGNEGAANVGFWFLQDGTVNCLGPETGGGSVPFVGNHRDGDLLVVSEFTQGGTVSTIQVFRWTGGADGCIDNPTMAGSCDGQPVVSGNDCRAANAPLDDDACATVNLVPLTPPTNGIPWLTVEKTTVGHSLQPREFFEGGINLTDTGLGGKCFNTFLASTRASQELGANLHDFSRGSLGACVTELTTTPKDGLGGNIVDTDSDGLPEVTIGTGAAGVDVTDSANLTVAGADTWSGTLHFFLCGPIATGTCDTGGLEIGSGTPVNQDTVMPVLSGSANLTSVGRYCWRGFFDSATDDVDDDTDSSIGECFEVLPVTPALATQAGPDVTLGDPINDSSTLIGTAFQPGTNGPNATYPSINADMVTPANGTITFTLFGPDNCTDVPTGFTPIDVTVSGDRTTHPGYTASFTPTQVGEFTWVATYDGDSPNTNGAGPTACPDANEAVVVTGEAFSTTAQDWLPNDTATITGDTNLNGTLTFQLYTGNNCGVTSGSAVPGQSYSFTLDDVPSPAIRSTTNTTFKVTAANQGAYSWLVHYDDTTLTDPPDRCETSTVSITD
jgi:hypothetical protein